MGIFQTKPSMVEAEQIPLSPSTEDLQKIAKWMGWAVRPNPFGVNFVNLSSQGRIITALYGDWIVKIGDDRFEVLDNTTFNARYSWIGPKEHYDAPYMVN